MENLDHSVTSVAVTSGSSSNNKKSSNEKRRSREVRPEPEPDQQPQHRRTSAGAKKENRKSSGTSAAAASIQVTGNRGSPSRPSGPPDKSGKRRDHPSGVGAVGGRGSILHNTVNPLLSEVNY